MDQRNPVGPEQCLQFAKIFAIVKLPNVFQHADRYDAIEGLLQTAIIAQLEPDPVFQPRVAHALHRQLVLFRRQRYPGNPAIQVPCQVDPHAAPA